MNYPTLNVLAVATALLIVGCSSEHEKAPEATLKEKGSAQSTIMPCNFADLGAPAIDAWIASSNDTNASAGAYGAALNGPNGLRALRGALANQDLQSFYAAHNTCRLTCAQSDVLAVLKSKTADDYSLLSNLRAGKLGNAPLVPAAQCSETQFAATHPDACCMNNNAVSAYRQAALNPQPMPVANVGPLPAPPTNGSNTGTEPPLPTVLTPTNTNGDFWTRAKNTCDPATADAAMANIVVQVNSNADFNTLYTNQVQNVCAPSCAALIVANAQKPYNQLKPRPWGVVTDFEEGFCSSAAPGVQTDYEQYCRDVTNQQGHPIRVNDVDQTTGKLRCSVCCLTVNGPLMPADG